MRQAADVHPSPPHLPHPSSLPPPPQILGKGGVGGARPQKRCGMPASGLSDGTVCPSIPGMEAGGGCEATARWPQCVLVQISGGLQGPEGASSWLSPPNHPHTPAAAPSPSRGGGALFPSSDPRRRRSGGGPQPHYQPAPAWLRQHRAATERVVHRWQACGWE